MAYFQGLCLFTKPLNNHRQRDPCGFVQNPSSKRPRKYRGFTPEWGRGQLRAEWQTFGVWIYIYIYILCMYYIYKKFIFLTGKPLLGESIQNISLIFGASLSKSKQRWGFAIQWWLGFLRFEVVRAMPAMPRFAVWIDPINQNDIFWFINCGGTLQIVTIWYIVPPQ